MPGCSRPERWGSGWGAASLAALRWRSQPTASRGYQAAASHGGAVTGSDANGIAAAALPIAIIRCRYSQALPPASHIAASPSSGTWIVASSAPTGAASAQHSITTGTIGTTSTFASGATSDRRSKLRTMTGSVVSCAARVSAIGSRSAGGSRRSRRSIPAPNQISPAVARSDS